MLSLADVLDPCQRPSLATFRQDVRTRGLTAEDLQTARVNAQTDLTYILTTGPAYKLLEDESFVRLYHRNTAP